MSKTPFLLASTSTSRRVMLEAAGVAFSMVAPGVDEDVIKNRLSAEGADAATIAHALAEAKAFAVSQSHPDALVLGADQILICDGRIFNKALDEDEARHTLLALRGQTHELICAAVLAKNAAVVWRRTDIARLTMRDFSESFLDEYLTAEMPELLGSVGCYRIEGRGVQLFGEVKGDHFSIRGLPLMGVLGALRDLGALSP